MPARPGQLAFLTPVTFRDHFGLHLERPNEHFVQSFIKDALLLLRVLVNNSMSETTFQSSWGMLDEMRQEEFYKTIFKVSVNILGLVCFVVSWGVILPLVMGNLIVF